LESLWENNIVGGIMKKIFIAIVFSVITLNNIGSAYSQDKLDLSFDGMPQIQNKIWGWNMSPDNFLPEGGSNIYLENVKKPMHAWFLAFVPGAYSMLVTMLNKNWDDQGDEDTLADSKFYFAALPTASGTLYAERYLEASLIWVGQSVGSYFIWSYFNLPRGDRNENINTFYMGVGIYAFFWLADMIYAPIMAWKYNQKLSNLFLRTGEENKDEKEAYNYNNFQLPQPKYDGSKPASAPPMPFMVGTSFKF
jgi:hypothetical protein